ncbi:class I SAM-dependent methyltransferase [Nocardioides abyssi]|uniref:Class I SAM-dependent methyltransferase n=1 Tax=Nocardioides abyssi TaxID=3058370 RepID=A0ABT8ETE4_9ACTN|nr:class I SAM-dependent methyltransferase [Nocardioides abyssi]MDN4161425.1 class I SAM-dependent methyltransferase [Nocardioides abyssi]
MADQSPATSPSSGAATGPGRSFGGVVDAYDRGRPSYPREAAAWLAGTEACTVLEVGAGTGKLTAVLAGLGHDVHATEPDPALLAVLKRDLPDIPVSESPAEDLPLPDGSVDVVVAAQSVHWFDHERALPEIARVLRPGGRLALVWNVTDTRIPWVRRLGALLGTQEHQDEPAAPVVTSPHFGFVEEASFKHWQVVDRESIRDLALSRSNIATLAEPERAEKVAEVVAFYDDYGRGMDGMQLPYVARCFRATVVRDDASSGSAGADEEPEGARDPMTDTISDGTDTDMLLIDFR